MKRLLSLVLVLVMMTATVSSLAEVGLEPYDETVIVDMMMSNDPNIPFWNGESFDDNIVEKMFRDYLNIDFQAKWLIDSTQYDSQLNLAINGNELPDMFVASKAQVYSMAVNGQITDMTDIYEEYITDSAREVLEFQGGVAFDPVTVDGRIYALPLPNDFSDEITVMYIRQDWLDALGREAPTTLDELIDLAIAFATEDPDGNGVDDTFGIATDCYLNYLAELIGHPLNAYRGIWVTDEDGKLVHGEMTDEYKEMIKVVNKLYHAGGIDSEFAVKDINSMANDIAVGKCGIYPGSFWAIYWMLGMSMDNDINANWKAYPIIAKEDGSYNPRALDTTYRYLVVRSGFEHPEAAVKAVNLWQEMWQGSLFEEYNAIGSLGYDTDLKYYSPIFFDPPYKNIEKAVAVKTAMETGDTSVLITVDQQAMYDEYQNALEKENARLIWMYQTDIDAFHVLKDDYKLNFRYSAFNGPTTAEISEYSSWAGQAVTGMITDMIMGDAEEIDSKWDAYIAAWYSNGGTELTEEVQKWYDAKNAE